MKKKPITVVTVVWNDLSGFLKTKESLNRQTFHEYQWVIIDGASTDGTAQAVTSLDDENIIAISEPDNGIYDAMNKGLKLSTGEYIVFMNAGDLFYSEKTLETVAKRIIEDNPDIIYGDSIDANESKNDYFYKKTRGHKKISYGMFACHQSIYYKNTKTKDIQYSTEYKIAGDYDFTARILKSSKNISYINEPLSIFDSTGISNSRSLLGRQENWRVQKETLALPLTHRIYNQIIYALASLVKHKLNFIYRFSR